MQRQEKPARVNAEHLSRKRGKAQGETGIGTSAVIIKRLRPAGKHKPWKKPGEAPINEANPSQENVETGR
jgi:hypothetical protein